MEDIKKEVSVMLKNKTHTGNSHKQIKILNGLLKQVDGSLGHTVRFWVGIKEKTYSKWLTVREITLKY